MDSEGSIIPETTPNKLATITKKINFFFSPIVRSKVSLRQISSTNIDRFLSIDRGAYYKTVGADSKN